jgi:hypothetical protein
MAKMNDRPVLLANNNLLYPYIPGSVGWHIFRMLKSRVPNVTRRNYLRVFDRYSMGEDAYHLRAALRNRIVVILGGAPYSLNLSEQLVYPQVIDNVTWRRLPLPGDHWYDDPRNKAVAAMVFESLYLSWIEVEEKCSSVMSGMFVKHCPPH